MKFGNHYPVVPKEVIDGLKQKEDASGYIDQKYLAWHFTVGQKVMIAGDFSESLFGLFQGMRGNDRALILLDFLDRQTKTTVPIDLLQPV